MLYQKGHEFVAPNGEGYRLTRDVYPGDNIQASDLEPFGGAPKPEFRGRIPRWFVEILKSNKEHV